MSFEKSLVATGAAAVMAASVLAAPASAAAGLQVTNKMDGNICTLQLFQDGKEIEREYTNKNAAKDTIKKIESDPEAQFALSFMENLGSVAGSAALADPEAVEGEDVVVAAVWADVFGDYVSAVRACADGKDYNSDDLTGGEIAAIVIGVVAVLGLIAGAAAPAIMPMLNGLR